MKYSLRICDVLVVLMDGKRERERETEGMCVDERENKLDVSCQRYVWNVFIVCLHLYPLCIIH